MGVLLLFLLLPCCVCYNTLPADLSLSSTSLGLTTVPYTYPLLSVTMNPNFLGGIEVGTLCAVILLGMVTVQIYVYYANFPGDSRMIKTLIAVVWLIEAAHAGAICYGLYKITVKGYGRLDLPIPVELCAAVILGSVVHPLVQAIFTARIYQLGASPRNRILTAVCWAISGFIFGATALLAYKVFGASSIDQFEEEWNWLIYGLFGATAAVDLLISGAMGFYTSRSRATLNPERVNRLDTLILWTAQTGLFNGVTAVGVVVVFAIMKRNHIWIALLILNTGLYSNSLLSLLNGRLHLGFQTEAPFTISLSTRQTHRSDAPTGFSLPPPAHLKPKSPPLTSALTSPITGSPKLSSKTPSHAGSFGMQSPPSSLHYGFAREPRLEHVQEMV